MASVSVGENQLQRIIRDLHDAVAELSKEHRETGEPVTDDNSSLHKFSYKLEYLLQFDQKEKTTFLGIRKDYWDYFCDCLAKLKGANDGIRFVKSIPELKTSLGKGRAFIRYSLVHQRLADTLQQCLMNHKVTSEWYYARSPFLKSHLSIDIINHLYELNEIQFDVASRGHDLDSDWPTFARRTLGTGVSTSHLWRPPSRCSSVNSLVSNYSQSLQQPAEFLPGPDFSPCLLGELSELGNLSSCSAADDLRVELDQSELRQQELLERVRLLTKEAGDLRLVICNLEGQLSSTESAGQKKKQQQCAAGVVSGRQEVAHNQQAEETKANGEFVNHVVQADAPPEVLGVREASESDLQAKLSVAEKRNMELLAKLDGALTEKSQQAASYCDSAWKIQELLAKLKEAEAERLEARQRHEELGQRAELLAQELRLREQSLRESGERLAAAEEERAGLLRQAEELRAAVGRLQGALSLKERETGNLRTQLQDLQGALETRERQAEDREALQQRNQSLKEEQVKSRDAQTETASAGPKKDPTAKKVEDYKAQCTTLMELNAKLLQTVKRNEESTRELAQARQAAERELAALRVSEAQLRTRLEEAQLPLEECERRLLEENRRLEESAQQALARAEEAEEEARKLEREREERREEHAEARERLASAREELSALTARTAKLEERRATSEEKQEELRRQLEEAESRSRSGEEGEGELGASGHAVVSRLALAEAQRELQSREVLRLQEEASGLRAQLQQSTEERLKTQALQEVTEASREDLRAQAQQLKAQVEEMNRRHVDELLRGREREEALAGERDREARERAAATSEAAALREEHGVLKRRLDALAVENAEAREALHRANTETAELGVHVCALTGQNEEARRRWEALSERLRQMEEEAAAEACRLNTSLKTLREENSRLQEELRQAQPLPASLQEAQGSLEETRGRLRSLQEESQREIQDLKLQLSSSGVQHEARLQCATEELEGVRTQLVAAQQQISVLQTKLKEVETVSLNSGQSFEVANTHVANSVVLQKEEEVRKLKGDVSKAEEQLALAQKACQDLSESLRRTTVEKQTSDLKTSAEIDDLYRTKRNLEERLIELIRDKDALWQKSDALEFEQKLREEEQTDREQSHCLGCHSQFSWWLRKHNCRLCGRAFCYYCCSNTVSTQQGGTRERCCKDCYTQHSAVVERHPQEELGTPPYPPFNPLTPPSSAGPSVRVAEPPPRAPDDGVFDIITEEEVNCIYDGDSLSYTTACSPGTGRQEAEKLNSSTSADDATTEEPEEIIATVQDAELCLLKSGELTLSVPFGVDEIAQFGDEFRELFVKSSCYSIIPIAVGSAGPTISWVFSSEPKRISFSMVYRDNTDIPLEQGKVMIPLTRCNSHKETIQGQLKVRSPGEYTLIFDNSFSRFISKKVLYRLSVEKPVVYDGSDCP
ncbi:FYVE and coiled-coil domain-containing protein 1 isoform X1 [Alosa sapidissima]|uniref:FYVE and coiled-coil domain-containing protein 1 isoform X1 n=2 Tax=Alosa sapidissima TaxID=34773 RepID=UPI001C099ADB|nr:FYVE and coiled-coil domain-containing protein 1 isoform X1 [Alosa sapidissima]XP_041958460.1 FYVE and coiled-coil domain-containing protein 1 isoform X1 [Alosa sapidissima]XP_041958461.1 FYVE and coiled-coil domain-containing protein 1 isoform X1 [Alosa sapidissima]